MISAASQKRVEKILRKAKENLRDKPSKTRITITIDVELDEILKKMGDKINVSHLCNAFMWYYINNNGMDNKGLEGVKK